MLPSRAVFFDVDGVLLDSLASHLRFCRDKSNEYGLGLSIPGLDRFRKMVRKGTVVSPMPRFFIAVGFPERFVQRADADYRSEFASRYAPRVFPGVSAMLARLAANYVRLGIITSNTMANIRAGLGGTLRFFDPRCVFAQDDSLPLSKAEALSEGARRLGAQPGDLIYVGDQPKDEEAARLAGARFLGVGYGWGLGGGNDDILQARDPKEVATRILASLSIG